MKIYAVIFDMDGVLVDSYEPHYASWKETCARRGLPFSRKLFDELFGRSFMDFAMRICPELPEPREIEAWHNEKETAYRRIIEQDFPEIDGAFDLIDDLAQAGFVIGIASSGARDNVDCLLEHLHDREQVSATISANETNNTKPHPEPFLKCADMLGVEPENCAVIEDSIYGLQAARSGGMKAIGLTSSRDRKTLEPYADLVVDSLKKLDSEAIRALLDR